MYTKPHTLWSCLGEETLTSFSDSEFVQQLSLGHIM